MAVRLSSKSCRIHHLGAVSSKPTEADGQLDGLRQAALVWTRARRPRIATGAGALWHLRRANDDAIQPCSRQASTYLPVSGRLGAQRAQHLPTHRVARLSGAYRPRRCWRRLSRRSTRTTRPCIVRRAFTSAAVLSYHERCWLPGLRRWPRLLIR
jgi:hypothetical protein